MRLGREMPVMLNDEDPLREQHSGKDGRRGVFHAPRAGGLPRMDVALHIGDVLRAGRYEIQRLLRSARDKKVYLARDRALGCQVTVDVFSNNSIMPGGLTVSAWEAHVLGQLGDHPNIATVIDHWEDDETAVMVSRYLSGGTLRDLIARSQESGEGLSIESILRLSIEIAGGLTHIHGRRILYRDLQPHNVLFDEWGAVHLVDFDTAVSLDDGDMSDLSHRPVIDYMAPELTDGEDADERADLYSLGATIYEMCDGRPPFTGTREEILATRRTVPPPSLERKDLPEALRELIFCLLAPEREQRLTSATEVVKRLEGLRTARADLERLLASDETTTLEFKSSLRTPVGPALRGDKRTPKELEQALEREVLDTLAAFLNTDGGTLIVGVADDRTIVGIEVDYPHVKGSSDGWRLTFGALVSRDLGGEVMNCIDLQLEPWHGRTIAVIRCSQREEPTWIRDELFVRRTASTEKLSARLAVAWWRQRWGRLSATERPAKPWT
jgi:serine/threonine protein kinase